MHSVAEQFAVEDGEFANYGAMKSAASRRSRGAAILAVMAGVAVVLMAIVLLADGKVRLSDEAPPSPAWAALHQLSPDGKQLPCQFIGQRCSACPQDLAPLWWCCCCCFALVFLIRGGVGEETGSRQSAMARTVSASSILLECTILIHPWRKHSGPRPWQRPSCRAAGRVWRFKSRVDSMGVFQFLRA